MRIEFTDVRASDTLAVADASIVFEHGDSLLNGLKLTGFKLRKASDGYVYVAMPVGSGTPGVFDFLIPSTPKARMDTLTQWLVGEWAQHLAAEASRFAPDVTVRRIEAVRAIHALGREVAVGDTFAGLFQPGVTAAEIGAAKVPR